MLSQEDIDNIINTIVRHYRPDKIILFGSYAQGNPTEDSDLDLLVIKDSDLPRYKRAREIHKLFNPYPVAMDILV
ncbi:MAG: nucleotidyltransferase domain-containing protein, partial [Anaerolineae bacterium]